MKRTLLTLLSLVLMPLAAGAEDTVFELRLERVKISRNGCVKITARIPSEELPKGFRAEQEAVSLSIGSTVILSLPPIDDRAEWRVRVMMWY